MDSDTIDLTMDYSDTALTSSDGEIITDTHAMAYQTGRDLVSKNKGPSPNKKARYVSVHNSEPEDPEYDLTFISSVLGNPINSIADLLQVEDKIKSESPYPYWGVEEVESTSAAKTKKRSYEEVESSGEESCFITAATTPYARSSPSKRPSSGSAGGSQKKPGMKYENISKDHDGIPPCSTPTSPIIARPQPRPTRRNIASSPKTPIKTSHLQPTLSSKGKKKSDTNTPITRVLTSTGSRSSGRISEEEVEELKVMAERSRKAAEEIGGFARRILTFLEQF